MPKERIKLIEPSIEMKPQAMSFRQAFLSAGEEKISGSCGLARFEDYAEWLSQLGTIERGEMPGRVPSTVYFGMLLPHNLIVGITDIRHYLTDDCYRDGHIGYAVRPDERRKGYGGRILSLALTRAYELGVIEAVVSCNKENRASRRVIKRNGLTREREIREENGSAILVYTKIL